MALLGSGVNPSLFIGDYSGYTNAANTKAQATAKLGSDTAGAIGTVMGGLDKQKSQNADISTAQGRIAGIIKAFPDQADQYQALSDTMSNHEIPISQRWAAAQAVGTHLDDSFKFASLGMKQEEERRKAADAAKATGQGGIPGLITNQ